MIFFIGDTIAQNESIDYLKAADQLHTLYEVLDEYGVFEKTTFLLGDCDYDPDFFVWRKRVNVQSLVKLPIGSNLRLKISHGDDLDIDELLIEGPMTDEKIYDWRRGYIPFDFYFETREKKRQKRRKRGRRKAEKEQSDQKKVIREEEVRITGHGKIVYCNKKHRLLVVPSIKDYWREKTHVIEIGLIGYGTNENQHEWNMTVLSPFEHKNEKGSNNEN